MQLSWDDYQDRKDGVAAVGGLASEKTNDTDRADRSNGFEARVEVEKAVEAEQPQPRVEPPMEATPAAPSVVDETAVGIQVEADSFERVTVDQKAMINCRADLNQLVPFKYAWAWQKYLDACANHWMPQEINMNADIMLRHSGLVMRR